MEFKLHLGKFDLKVTVDQLKSVQSGYILSGTEIFVQFPFSPEYYYSHGWQSWSLTSWIDAKMKLFPSMPANQRSRTIDPLYALEEKPNGSWLGAVSTPDGQVILLGALGLESHVKLDGKELSGFYEIGQGDWFLGTGSEERVFQDYANLLVDRLGKTDKLHPPRVWCSWYSMYGEISEDFLGKILKYMDDLPFDVFQVDDGWQKKVGDWEANKKFPSGMKTMAESIKATGRKAGLWLAPLLVAKSSSIFQCHKDWLLRDGKGKLVLAGINWFEKIYALDTTHPDVLEWLKELMLKARNWGFEYVKLDFLYAGALPGKRHLNIPRETAYRQALSVIRSALGDAYLLTCGAPILPSLGLCDGIRISQDIADYWNLNLVSRLMYNLAVPGIQNASRNSLNRLWLKSLVHTDPDVVFFSSQNKSFTSDQKNHLINLAHIADFKGTSDLPFLLTDSEREGLQKFLNSTPVIHPIDRYRFLIDEIVFDYSEYVRMPTPFSWYEKIIHHIVGNIANLQIIEVVFDLTISLQHKKFIRDLVHAGKL